MAERAEREVDYDKVENLDELVRLIENDHCTPGWIRREKPLLWAQPQSVFRPAHWEYARIKPALIAAGRLIGTDLAERRNFVLRNPVDGNDFATTRTLVGAYQSILPGERARSHRHSPHALRVILESRGSYSVVNGQRHPMETGDIVLTPGGCWHGHGHDGSEQAFWFDCLDLPLVQLLEPMTTEDHPAHWEADITPVAASPMLLSWDRTLSSLRACRDEPSEFFGKTIDLSAECMPTISIEVHSWSSGWSNRPYRRTANVIYVVLQGSGSSAIGECVFSWRFGDVIAAPMWSRIAHTVSTDAVVVALSDEKLMQFCGYYDLVACE